MKQFAILLAASLIILSCGGGRNSKKAEAQSAPAEAVDTTDLDYQWGRDLLSKGDDAPAFTLNDLEGNPVSLGDFAGKKVVLVFWASWCPDCRAEIPELKEMFAKADPSKVAFVSISFDRDFDTLKSFAAENELPGVQLFDPAGKKESQVCADYHVKWIPSLYLVNPEGKIEKGTVVAQRIAELL